MAQLIKRGEVLTEDQFPLSDWDQERYSPIIIDDTASYGVYRMYYTAYDSATFGSYGPAYATSTDLDTWTKPNLGIVTYDGNTDNNLLIAHGAINLTDIRILDGQYVIVIRNSSTTSNLIYTAPLNDPTNFTFVKNVFTNTTHGEHIESKGITYEGGVWRVYYSEGHFVPHRRSIGYYQSDAGLDGNWTDQGLISEFTSSSTTDQYYDFLPWNDGGALWACVPRYSSSDILGPLSLWRSTDDGLSWTQHGNLIENGAAGENDYGLIAAAKPIFVDGMWRMIYVSAEYLHFASPRPGYVQWAEGAITYEDDDLLKFHAPFDRTKSLTPTVGPAGACTRAAATATYFDESGVMQTALANVPRFDHNPATGASLGLLIEEDRSNFALQSEDFSTTWAAWKCTVDTNVADAPDGNTTMDRMNVDTDAGVSHFLYQAVSISTGTNYTYSAFVKDDGAGFATLSLSSETNAFLLVTADLTLGTVTDSADDGSLSTLVDSGIEDIGDGIYRIWVTGSVSSAGGPNLYICTSDSGTPSYDHNGRPEYTAVEGEDLLVWGAQIESGAFPTSYIKTTTVAVTRNKDETNWSDVSWFDDNIGTWYVKFTPKYLGKDAYAFAVGAGGSAADGVVIWVDTPAGTISAFRGTTTGNDGFIQMAAVATVDQEIEVAIAYQNNDMVMYVDGVAGTPDTSVTVPPTNAADNMKVGQNVDTTKVLNGRMAELRYYDTRLVDAEVEGLSNGKFPGFKRSTKADSASMAGIG